MTVVRARAYRADTIVACATPAGRGALAIVRCSGDDASGIRDVVFRPDVPGSWEPWRMRLGAVLAADGSTPIDQALGVYFPGPHSFTGEDTFEIHTHGSPLIVEQTIASAMAAGARAAGRGEFTRRAVLNGKLDLLQAEAIADLIDARMAAGARAAWEQLQGALSARLADLRERLVDVLAGIEADVDFTDDELPDVDVGKRRADIEAVENSLAALLAGYAASRRQREGLRVVFTGKPNAGKSSLINRLLESGRMIVSDEAGTTRDVVEEAVELEGVAFVLTDTAGIRDATGKAEAIAVERALESVAEADVCVLVVDASSGAAPGDEFEEQRLRRADTIVAWNKSDLLSEKAPLPQAEGFAGLIATSAVTGAGCADLADRLVATAKARLEADHAGISRVRHRDAVERSVACLRRASALAGSEDTTELVALELRAALGELAAIGDPVDNEDVLDRIFAEFCIGK